MKSDGSASIRCTHGPPDRIKRTCFLKGVITPLIKRAGAHLDRQIVIQGTRSKVFYNASQTAHPDAPSKIRWLRHFLKRSMMDCSLVTVDRFDRTVTPKYPIKRYVLPICKAFELEINPIDLFRHLPSCVP